MTALSADRNTPRFDGDILSFGVAASVTIHAGAMAMLNASGYATKGQTALGLYGVGRADQRVVNAGSAGDETIRVRPGRFRFANSSAADEITIAEIGKVCYAVDDQTVAKTSGSGTRSPAGFVVGVDAQGVHVEFDVAKIGAWLANRKKLVPLRLTTLAGSGSPAFRTISPFSGLVTSIKSVIEGALTTADATLTASIAGVAITNGAVTVTQAGSAAGDKDSATPTAANYVTAGDELKIVVTGTQDAAVAANALFEIDAD